MKELLRKLTVTAKDENGADAVEYAALIMVVGGLFAAVAGAIGSHGSEIGDTLANVVNSWIGQFA
jgi:Flp pilus assembly pilin Flp